MVACHDVAMPASRILIVEDDPRIAASVRRALTYDGYRVTTAASGPEGLSELRRTAPDLVVLDLMLPEVDGLEICRRIRESGDPVLILMLTARTAIAERVAGLDAGADDYLTKPFAHDELLGASGGDVVGSRARGDEANVVDAIAGGVIIKKIPTKKCRLIIVFKEPTRVLINLDKKVLRLRAIHWGIIIKSRFFDHFFF